jgi:hypothetical protein
MARSKRSTALYEVISAARQTPRSNRIHQASWWMRTKRWWNTLRPASAAPASVSKESVESASPRPPVVESAVDADPTMTAASPTPPSRQVDFAVDPERRQIALRMSYGTAMMAGGALVLIVLMSIAIGRYMTRGSVPLLAQTTTEELQKGPPHREVLEPLPRHVSASGDSATATPAGHVTSGAQTSASMTPRPPIAPTEPTKRYIGYNYVIIQSYPPTEAKMATDAAAFLNSHVVSCTIEQDIKGWRNYVCVVGLDGFAKQTSPECKAYIERIHQLSDEYVSKSSRGFKQFDPVVKKWDKPD